VITQIKISAVLADVLDFDIKTINAYHMLDKPADKHNILEIALIDV